MVEALPSGGEDDACAPPPGQGRTFAVIAAGGAIGALARYGVGLVLPHDRGSFPLGTLLINVAGCLLIGAIVVVVTERRHAGPLVRPFVVTGFLGGFTTFSTYAVDSEQLLGAGRVAVAAAYLAGTLVAAVLATWLGIRLGRAVWR